MVPNNFKPTYYLDLPLTEIILGNMMLLVLLEG
jgi:hypothetical protein